MSGMGRTPVLPGAILEVAIVDDLAPLLVLHT